MKKSINKFGLLPICILIGIAFFFFGAKTTYMQIQKSKNYVSIEGEFIKSNIYSSDEDGVTYSLTYLYKVDGIDYTVSTDYGTSIIPEIGTKKTIKYNPSNPNEAIIPGMGNTILLFFLGFMFTFIPLVMIFSIFPNNEKGNKQKTREIVLSFTIGFVFTVLGVGSYYLMCLGSDTLSLLYAWKTNGLWIIIPMLFVVIGVYIIIFSLLGKTFSLK